MLSIAANDPLGQFQLLVDSISTAGLLRVGCYQSAGARLLPPVLAEFTAAWPRVEVQLSETQDDGELLADLEGGRLDLTFVVFPLTAGPFEAVELLEDPYVLAVPEDSDLARRPSPVSLRHPTGVPLIPAPGRCQRGEPGPFGGLI